MKRIILLLTSSLIFFDLSSQEIGSFDVKETIKYIQNTMDEFRYVSKEIYPIPSYISKDANEMFASVHNFKFENSTVFLSNDTYRYQEQGVGVGHEKLTYKFDLSNVIIQKPTTGNELYKFQFSIKCNNNMECISFNGKLIRSLTLMSNSQTILTRLSNSFLHLQYLISNSAKKTSDPFESYNISDNSLPSISINDIKLSEENNNKRIDYEEKAFLKIFIKNHNSKNYTNLMLSIKELNALEGITIQGTSKLNNINGSEIISIDIPIFTNSSLQIGEAVFEVKITFNNKEVTKKLIKIATFNGGSESITVSKLPDVDINIPKTSNLKNNVYALIVGNEDYKSKQPSLSHEANVKYAINDAKIFKEYLIRTIGVPSNNITYIINATSAEIKQAINKVKQLPLVNPNAEIIFYFAGHGLPDERTKEQYIIPVDINSSNLSFGLKINEIESELSSNNPKQVLLIFDACFSGAARNESLLSNRAVRVRPKENIIKGNSIILSASSNEESSKAYDEMQHGMFTYFLLKKLQETKGNVDLQTLFDFVHFNVREKSLLINNQFQTPTITKSPQIPNNLNEIKF